MFTHERKNAPVLELEVASQHAGVSAWLRQCRLNGPAVLMRGVEDTDTERMALVADITAKAPLVARKLVAMLPSV